MKKVLLYFVIGLLLIVALSAFTAPVHAQAISTALAPLAQTEPIDDFGFLETARVGAVPLIVVIIGLVELFKKAGMTGNKLLFTSMCIGLILGAGYMIAQTRPPITSDWFPVYGYWFGVIVYGLAAGLAASGIYAAIKGMVDKIVVAIQKKE